MYFTTASLKSHFALFQVLIAMFSFYVWTGRDDIVPDSFSLLQLLFVGSPFIKVLKYLWASKVL
jgi:hypothetical protein